MTLRLKVNICMQVTLHFNASIFSLMQPVPLLVLVPALPVVSLSELFPEESKTLRRGRLGAEV